jgi:neutral ceramidase
MGPNAETFTIREGALRYAPFDLEREADGQIFGSEGQILSPIDEFNAPVGAVLCQGEYPLSRAGAMPGTSGVAPYGSCLRVDVAARFLGGGFGIDFGTDASHPVCQSTRTVVSALRLGEYLLGTLPGEPTVMIADLVREQSPVAEDHTIVVGYAQGHTGYLLRPEDWLRGGYEPSVSFWGPLEGEYVAEQLAALWPLVMSAERENASAAGRERLVHVAANDVVVVDDPAPHAGQVPALVPGEVWMRSGTPSAAQPNAEVRRVSGLARFVWIGDDPLVRTPDVVLEREISPGVFSPVRRRSGRNVSDGELLVTYTPQPLVRVEGEAQTHYWTVEWQAVPWIGAVGADGLELDALGARGALPLGRYRFRVEGDAFELASDAFEVVPAALEVRATLASGEVQLAVSLHAPQGYRLMDLELASNGPIPLRSQALEVTLIHASGPDSNMSVMTTDAGVVTIPASMEAPVEIRVRDAHGNAGLALL